MATPLSLVDPGAFHRFRTSADFSSGDSESTKPSAPPEPEGSGANGPAVGLQVLLVEDHTIIALDAENMLLDLGAASVHSFTTVDAALAWLATAHVDVGILDVALGQATSFPVAEVLAERAVPFIFTTGYGDSGGFPARFANAQIVRKPYVISALADALEACLQKRGKNA